MVRSYPVALAKFIDGFEEVGAKATPQRNLKNPKHIAIHANPTEYVDDAPNIVEATQLMQPRRNTNQNAVANR